MPCYNAVGTLTAALAVGVAVSDAASWSTSKARARLSIAPGEICQLCLGLYAWEREVQKGEDRAKRCPSLSQKKAHTGVFTGVGFESADFRISFLDALLSDVLHESLLVDPKRHHLRGEIAWHFGGGLPISAERSGQPRWGHVNATALHQPDTTQSVSLHDDLTVVCDQLVGVLGAALDHLE
jgi:hypothetical protein